MRLMAMLAVLLAMVACGDSEPELPELVEPDPAATIVAPTPTPEPTPTPTPEGDLGRASEIANAWVAANPDEVAAMVVEAALASEDAGALSPLVRTPFGPLLQVAVANGLGDQLEVTLHSVAHLSGITFGAGLTVEGRVTDLGTVSAVEVFVPFVLTMDLDAEAVTLWEVNVPRSTVTIEVGG